MKSLKKAAWGFAPIFVTLIMLFSLTGCAPTAYWYNKDRTYQRASVDCRECIYQARLKASDAAEEQGRNYDKSSADDKANEKKFFEECMTAKGYKETWDWKIKYNVRKGFIDQDKETYYIAGK